jgi:toxin FitB
MSGFLLDTNCISEMVRPRPEPRVVAWLESADEAILHLSILTIGEIRKGIAGLPQSKRRTRLEAWLEIDLQTRFSGRILSVDPAVADRWGLIAATAKQQGHSLPIIDGLLAATAIHFNLTIVSRNARDFAGTSAQTLNPWEV